VSGVLLIVLGMIGGLAGGIALHAVTRPRRWHPKLRRLRRYLLGQAWRPILLAPYVPVETTSPRVGKTPTPGAPPSSS
jgi:hypothetical protein